MRTLYHFWLSPASRKARIVLGEKKIAFEAVLEKPWERREAFMALNPAGEVPVLVEADGEVLCDATAICEYLDEVHPEPSLLGHSPRDRAEVRRLVGWVEQLFDRDVTQNLVGEKAIKRASGAGTPDSRFVRAGHTNLHPHLDYLGWLIERRNWLAGDYFSLADITAAAHISCVDYLGDVPWPDHPAVHDWYARVKSRPSFRPLLSDHMPGMMPPKHYSDLDF